MKISVMLIMFLIVCGCRSTDTVPRLHEALNKEVDFLHKRHIETIEAYGTSLQQTKSDITSISSALEASERERLSALSQRNQATQNVLVSEVLSQYDQRVYDEIIATFDQTLEAVFWPNIVNNQNAYRDKEEALGAQLAAHQCHKVNSGCSNIGFDNYRKLAEQYRTYGVLSEYIIHLGYKQESEIWQRLSELTHQFKQSAKAQAQQVSIKTNGSEDLLQPLKGQLKVVTEKLDSGIDALQQERNAMTEHWTITKQSLVLLQQEVNKPEVWELILAGGTERVKDEVAIYTSAIQETVGGIAGAPVGNVAATLFDQTVNGIVDNSVRSLGRSIEMLFSNAENQVQSEVTDFLQLNKLNP